MYLVCGVIIIGSGACGHRSLGVRTRILVQVTIYRRLLIGRDDHLDQSETYDISYENTDPGLGD